MQRPQAPEVGPRQVEVESGEGELPGDEVADEKADDTPENGGDRRHLDGPVHVALLLVGAALARVCHHVEGGAGCGKREEQAVKADDLVGACEQEDEADDADGNGGEDRRDGRGRNELVACCLHPLLHCCRRALIWRLKE